MTAFVEFGRETSDTKSAEFKTLFKMVPYELVFILLACFVIRL